MQKKVSLLIAFLVIIVLSFNTREAEASYVVKADMMVNTLPENSTVTVKPGIAVPAQGVLKVKVFLANSWRTLEI